MIDALRQLDAIETSYTVFEKDQVLTPEQLNSLSGYLDDQERLTRVALNGVGIACGLWATLDGNRVRLSHGIGTTTDGDLVFMPQATFYDRYKPYDAEAPAYEPFGRGQDRLTAYELVREGESDNGALVLSGFTAREGRELKSMAAVLYMESYLRDEDLCTGTDCDNRGKDSVHTLKLLLVERDSAAALATVLPTPDGAARTPLRPVVPRRPQLGAALQSSADLAAVYAAACAPTHDALLAAFRAFYRPCRWFLEDFVPADPAPRWTRALEEHRDRWASAPFAQYYYDFLKDLADTWNAFVDCLYGDSAVCCPDLAAFPKHLVLGAIDAAQRSPRERTAFYPSPAVSAAFEQRARARFLVRKLDTLLVTFAPPRETPGIRITPSAFEDRALEQRAIPFYYAVREDAPIYRAWSYALSRRGMERFNYSYNAERYGAEGAAAAPLQAQLGAFDFFRIEGHLGRPVEEARKVLDAAIRGSNLPIDLEYVRFDKPPKRWRPPRPRFDDLYRFHHLLRADVEVQLNDAAKFGDRFLQQVSAAAGNVITDQDNGNVPVLGTAQAKTERMAGNTRIALQKIGGETYQRDWHEALTGVTQAAAELNDALSPVTKKEFVTPLDQLIAGQPTRWLDWLDVLIDDAEDKEAGRAQFSTFLREHPGLEHYAGVLRGGTFVLVCDAQDIVVADFMLPYSAFEQRAEPAKPPKLTAPLRPDIVFEKPIRLVAIPDKFRFAQMRNEVELDLKKDVEVHKKYFETYKDALGTIGGGKLGATLPPKSALTDSVLDTYLGDTRWKTEKVDRLRDELLDPQLGTDRRVVLERELKTAETELAGSILAATEYVAAANVDVARGTEGATVMSAASASLAKVSDLDALTQVERGLTAVSGRTATRPEVKTVINTMLAGRIR